MISLNNCDKLRLVFTDYLQILYSLIIKAL